MFSLFTNILITLLVVSCLAVVLIILAQRASSDAGLGATLGGGAAESVLGSEAGNFLSRWTMAGTTLILCISFVLYLIFISRAETNPQDTLPSAESFETKDEPKPSLLFPEKEPSNAQ